MGLPTPLAGIDVLLGRDVADQLLFILDGPRQEFTIADCMRTGQTVNVDGGFVMHR